MKNRKIVAAIAATGALVASVLGGAAVANADTPAGSDAAYYIVDSGTGTAPAATPLAWNADVSGSPEANNSTFDKAFAQPVGATKFASFLSPQGGEESMATWNISTAPAAVASALLPTANWSSFVVNNGAQTPGSVNAVRAAGGNYSVGIAWLNNANQVVSAIYTHVQITAGTGAWTFDAPTAGPVDCVANPTDPACVPPADEFDVNLNAQVASALDGALSLVAPASLNVTLAQTGFTNGTNGLSVSTGSLGQFAVVDERYLTHPGWTLTANLTPFSFGSNTVPQAQLGLKPVAVATGTTAQGVTLGAEQVAGSATYPATFASANNNANVGRTNLNADLRFVAPASAPAGTYTSVLTITLAGS